MLRKGTSKGEFKMGKKKKLRVLMAEDESRFANLVEKFFKAEGHHIEIVENGQKLIDRMEELSTAFSDSFDVVVTDYMMPVMNGLEVLEKIRRDERFKGTPVVVYSGTPTVKDRVKKLEGVFICKAEGVLKLISLIEQLLKREK